MRRTPTLSMRIYGQSLKEEGDKRRRSEAAKKAWKTRRRNAKPSPLMGKILEFLARKPTHRFSVHYHGSIVYHVSLCSINDDGSHAPCENGIRPKEIRKTTFRAMEKRGWLEFARRRDSGGTLGTLPDGSHGIVTPSFDLDYKISPKGLKTFKEIKS